MQKLKVLHVIEALGGGVYSYFCDLTHSLAQDPRVTSVVVYNDQRSEIIPENISRDFHSSTRLIKVNMNESIHPVKDYKAILELQKVFVMEQPDVIHLHSSKAGVLGKLAAKKNKFNGSLYYTPHGYSFLRKDISGLKAYLFKKIEKAMASYHSATTIACGDTEYKVALELHDRVALIRNGIRISALQSSPKKTTNTKLKIGILGRITHARDPEFFNAIATALPAHQFIWIGDGILGDKITASNIEVTGWFMNREEGIKKLQDLDIYLQTSLWEGLPIAVLEAMAFYKPVVATNVIGNKDVVVHKKTGFLIENLQDAIQAITALESEAVREKMGRLGHERVASRFNSDKNFAQLVDLYIAGCSSTGSQKC